MIQHAINRQKLKSLRRKEGGRSRRWRYFEKAQKTAAKCAENYDEYVALKNAIDDQLYLKNSLSKKLDPEKRQKFEKASEALFGILLTIGRVREGLKDLLKRFLNGSKVSSRVHKLDAKMNETEVASGESMRRRGIFHLVKGTDAEPMWQSGTLMALAFALAMTSVGHAHHKAVDAAEDLRSPTQYEQVLGNDRGVGGSLPGGDEPAGGGEKTPYDSLKSFAKDIRKSQDRFELISRQTTESKLLRKSYFINRKGKSVL